MVTVNLPPLRQRREDIVPLVDHYRRSLAKHHGKKVGSVAPAVAHRLFTYAWPGNVRELINCINTMIVLDQDGELGIDDLPPELTEGMEDIAAEGSEEEGGSLQSLVGHPLSELEKRFIAETLQYTAGNREQAAEMLGIGTRTLYRKIKEFEL